MRRCRTCAASTRPCNAAGQLQAAAAVHRHSGDAWERRRMAAYLHELQDNVIESGFFAEVAAVS